MPTWLAITKGPLFYFALAILILGLARLIVLALWGIAGAIRRAGDRRIPYARVLKETVAWLVPLPRLHRVQPVYSYASFFLHLGVILSGLALQNHIDILSANVGLAWPGLPRLWLDGITLAAMFATVYLVLHRVYIHRARVLSRPMDYLLLLLILNLLVSGYVAGRSWNPVPYDGLMLFHVANGLLLFVLTPFTKIAHCVLFPLVRLASEVAWYFPRHGGSDVIKTLYGTEGRKI